MKSRARTISPRSGFVVYTIHDPRDGSPFYVGQTGSLARRIMDHLALTVPSTAPTIAVLLATDLIPAFRIATRAATWREAHTMEARTLARMIAAGAPLTNPKRDFERANKIASTAPGDAPT